MAGSVLLTTPGYPTKFRFSGRSFGGRAIDIGKISDVDGSWSFATPVSFTGGITKNGATVLAGNPFLVVTQDGNNGAGSLALAGAVVGDKVMAVTGLTTPADLSASFESTITVAGHIQQSSASDLSAKLCQFILIHQS
jgi:hypothetical protein